MRARQNSLNHYQKYFFSTKTGAKFKARALQYCLEDKVSEISDEDWIVHVSERVA